MLPSSPRLRRRIAWVGCSALVAVTAVGTMIAVPDGPGAPAAQPSAAPPAPAPKGERAPAERPVPLTPALRSEINRTLARFIPAGVRRDDPALAWELAGPKLRTGWTRADWVADRIPLFPYPARAKGFESWRKIYAYENRVGLDLVLHPTDPDMVTLAVAVEMVRKRGRWLVDEWVPVASFQPTTKRQWTTGIADFQAGGFTEKSYDAPRRLQARLGSAWLAVPAALLGLVVVVPTAVVLASVRRDRRARARHVRSLDAPIA